MQDAVSRVHGRATAVWAKKIGNKKMKTLPGGIVRGLAAPVA